ncbi:hypothetical protein ROSINTL182_07122 [Roseburia intestinalis L1-82]|jgi:hypothetical protein|uniref:Uncharacterized protein n=1 Tax=Roseburia intestinalis L1-82 TaxID=536231 RepID=C7GB39_9FIRM|nr:hypothetical protein ROSINTL182_07122 [Roseburia intestinalis L1-82]
MHKLIVAMENPPVVYIFKTGSVNIFVFIISDMTGSYKKQFLCKKYFIGSTECATMGKCKNQEMRKTNEIK